MSQILEYKTKLKLLNFALAKSFTDYHWAECVLLLRLLNYFWACASDAHRRVTGISVWVSWLLPRYVQGNVSQSGSPWGKLPACSRRWGCTHSTNLNLTSLVFDLVSFYMQRTFLKVVSPSLSLSLCIPGLLPDTLKYYILCRGFGSPT